MKNIYALSAIAIALVSADASNAQSYVGSVVGNPLATQGLSSDLVAPVPASRSDFSKTYGAPEATDGAADGFYALGFGGEIILEMATPICNVAGDDFTIYETTFGNPPCNEYPEKARVWVSQDLCNWVELTNEANPVCQNASFDLGCLPWVRYVKVKDVSNPADFAGFNFISDGYDIDGIIGASGCSYPSETGLSAYAANGSTPSQGLNEIGNVITPFRSVASRMHGLPLNPFNIHANDATTSPANNNFYSLGKNGSVILTLPYTLFDGPGADLQVFETSFNDKASRTCGNYPEKAKVEGSCDGRTYFDLTILPADAGNGEVAGTNIICRDGKLDFNGNAYVNYIRITDVTFNGGGNFPGVGDGFDVDAVLGLQNCSAAPRLAESADQDNGMDVFEDAIIIETFPNPVSDVLTISALTATNDQVSIRITDMLGRNLYNEMLSNPEAAFTRTIDMSIFSTGVYTVTVESASGSSVSRVVKK
jgi:hypothetical protein